jgi:hypothetical protein
MDRDQLKQAMLALYDGITGFLLDNVPDGEMWEDVYPCLDAVRTAIDEVRESDELGDVSCNYLAKRFTTSREQFATRKTDARAAELLRTALNAHGANLIDNEELEGVMLDVIEYLERN